MSSIICFVIIGIWCLALYNMRVRLYKAEKENEKINKLWDEDWKDLKEKYSKTVYFERENINLKGEVKKLRKDNERLKELNQACMEKIIVLKGDWRE